MMKILNYGGMMQFEKVSMFGHDMGLLKPVEIYPGGKVSFHYNYFEDDAWETACFDAHEACFWSGKIGGYEFNSVVLAAYTLFDLYDPDPGFVMVNGDIVDPDPYVGWINHLLGTKFTHEKRFRLWEMAECCALPRAGEYSEALSFNTLLDIIPARLLRFAGGTDFSDLCYITQGTESLSSDQIEQGSYPADVLECKHRLEIYFRTANEDDAIDKLWKLLQLNRSRRKKHADRLLGDIAEMTLHLPARVFVYLATELKELDFWETWNELHNCVYHDEKMKAYASPSLCEMRKQAISAPVPDYRTSSFLREDGWSVFLDTPGELKDKPEYIVSDDDRLYWWDGTDEVVISDNMDSWLRELSGRHSDLIKEVPDDSETTESDAHLREFLSLLADIDKYYIRIHPFRNMFYDFVRNGSRKEYKAALALMRMLYEENKEEGAAIQHLKGSWELASRKVTFNPGRVRMKRFMSVMANEKLRMKYFGF